MELIAALTGPQSPSSILAGATTVHLVLGAIRNHRTASTGSVSPFAVISLVLATLPWVFPSYLGLAFGFGTHFAWFLICEAITPRSAASNAAHAGPVRHQDVAPATSPLIAAAARLQPSKGFVQTPILAIFDETPSIKTVRLARPDGFEFIAGQFVTVRVRVDGKEYARCYSISSGPDVRGYLEISIKGQGLVSHALHAMVRPGGMLSVKAPAGAFRYPADDDRPIVMLAGGIGITPLISMLRHAATTEPTRPVTLLYSAHAEDEFAFRDELMSMARRHPQVRVQLAASKPSSDSSIYPGRIDESLLRATVPDLEHSVAFVCGPHAMIEGTKTLLRELGMPAAQIRQELFQQAVAASACLVSDVAPGSNGPGDRPRSRRTRVDHRMLCSRTGKTVAIHGGQTILEAAEEGGIALDSLCRAGVCGTCRVQVNDGDVGCESTVLDADDQAQGFVLACVSTANSDCTVNL